MIKIVEFGVNTGDWKISKEKFGTVLQSAGFKQSIKINDLSRSNSKETVVDVTDAVYESVKDSGLPKIMERTFDIGNMYVQVDPATFNTNVFANSSLTDEHLFVILLPEKFKMVRFLTDCEICGTFRANREGDKEKYFGCLVKYNPVTMHEKFHDDPKMKKGYDACVFRAQGKYGNDYVQFHANVLNEHTLDMEYCGNVCHSENLITNIKKDEARRKGKPRFFSPSDMGICTKIVVVGASVTDDEISKLLDDHGTCDDYEVVRLHEKSTKRHLLQRDEKQLTNVCVEARPRVRAITTYKCEIPQEFIKTLRLLYVFNADATGKVKATKSL